MQEMQRRGKSRSTRSGSGQAERSRVLQVPPRWLHPSDCLPAPDDSVQLTKAIGLVAGEIGIDQFKDPFGGIGSWGEVEA
jgi:hypothetical protein